MNIRTVILGAGAAGLMAAAHAGGDTLIVDHARAPGEKIRISGGGRCNFTNLNVDPERFLGENPHFHKSALARYTQWDFIDLVHHYGIAWHEKTLGQLFCDGKATQIVSMLRQEAEKAGATLALQTALQTLRHDGAQFHLSLEKDGQRLDVQCQNLVVATGGKSIPKMGATGMAYDIARQFGLRVTPTRPGLVPLTFDQRFAPLSGTALPVRATAGRTSFDEALLFTHRGLSGPAVLQISSYWQEGTELTLNLVPGQDIAQTLRAARRQHGRRSLTTELALLLPARLVAFLEGTLGLKGNLGDLSDRAIDALSAALTHWRLRPTGTEGYRTAEVTLGGVATDGLDSKTMACKTLPQLYFIGEAVDVTGWLGGYNFQWAWASGYVCGQDIARSA